ncbi:alpha/beta hydrolase [Natribacillus halophilus]|uniref:Lysophospholipase, alpha-beta hydrolase superfamily n=1 Tax=Natribacillus halophilus TaxID=549003 RepID=A0A1G8R3D8_9BACI|nr:alpha/beta hydrolase [Natribacillus halophilus]SDJ11487.1 Lysophospholipase, alpha-beta hydrolase superfamily [Natribacillus halophilus]
MERLQNYLDYYGLPTDLHYRHFRLNVAGAAVFMQRFTPVQAPREEILLLHGFMEHIGPLAPFIRSLTAEGYSVSAVDFQGHGLSGGQRYRVDNFSEYEATLESALLRLAEEGINPRIMIGHSTGAGVAAHYALARRELDMQKLILVAPLARFRGWRQAKLGMYAASSFLKDVPRRYRPNSSDEAYLEQQRTDPLQASRIPLAWVRAMFEWEARFRELPAHPLNIDIFQGTDDRTVAWEHNVRFFREKFPNATISLIKDGKHQLFNEGEPIRSIVYHLIHRSISQLD